MSSIDGSQRTMLVRFFEERLRGRTVDGPKMRGNERDRPESYYVERNEGVFARERFELAFSDVEQIEAALNDRWAGGPYEGLATALLALSQHFRRVEEKRHVSDFVYEMF